MTTSLATSSSVFLQGVALSLGLIVAIGAQNAFVLRQGLRREHVGSVVLFCAMTDALLILAGVLAKRDALARKRMLCFASAGSRAFSGGRLARATRSSNWATCGSRDGCCMRAGTERSF